MGQHKPRVDSVGSKRRTSVDDGVLSDNAVLGGVSLDDLELDTPTDEYSKVSLLPRIGLLAQPSNAPGSSLGEEGVALADGTVGLEEVGLEEDVEDVTGET